MTAPAPEALFQAIEATWPPARTFDQAGWRLREGQGGGQRVSAATRLDPDALPRIDVAEAAMRNLGQPPLFMIRTGDDALDVALDRAGYTIGDPTDILIARTSVVAGETGALTPYPAWPLMRLQEDIWASGGIGPDRVAVMRRARGPATALLGRQSDAPAATAFIAVDGPIAMLHALEVRVTMRRQGVGKHMMRAAANWAHDQNADWLAVLVVQSNAAAMALYRSLGMTQAATYHYRRVPE